LFEVKAVQDTMQHRREDEGCAHDEQPASIQSKDSGEELARESDWRIDRPHAAQEHGGIEERVNPQARLAAYANP
jgi:hypothetical protein